MRANTSVLFSGATMTGTTELDSPAIEISQQYGFCIQASWTGTPVGTIVIQASAQASVGDIYYTSPTTDPGVTWTEIASTSQAVSGAGSFLWNIDGAYYRYVRLVYTNTSSTGALSAVITVKGI